MYKWGSAGYSHIGLYYHLHNIINVWSCTHLNAQVLVSGTMDSSLSIPDEGRFSSYHTKSDLAQVRIWIVDTWLVAVLSQPQATFELDESTMHCSLGHSQWRGGAHASSTWFKSLYSQFEVRQFFLIEYQSARHIDINYVWLHVYHCKYHTYKKKVTTSFIPQYRRYLF